MPFFYSTSIRIWSKTGKVVATCTVIPYTKYNNNMKPQTHKPTTNASLHWYKADGLLISDGRTNLLECNPLLIDW